MFFYNITNITDIDISNYIINIFAYRSNWHIICNFLLVNWNCWLKLELLVCKCFYRCVIESTKFLLGSSDHTQDHYSPVPNIQRPHFVPSFHNFVNCHYGSSIVQIMVVIISEGTILQFAQKLGTVNKEWNSPFFYYDGLGTSTLLLMRVLFWREVT